MATIDLKRDLKHLYNPSAKAVSIVDVPPMHFLMIDGRGDPNTSPEYADAVSALYAVSYAIKFMLKKAADAFDYSVMPLEGLWWSDDPSNFTLERKDIWEWTMMILQPDAVTERIVEDAMRQTAGKKDLPALSKLRFAPFTEGKAAQVMHLGPYTDEGPTVARVHDFINARGYTATGKHHEIYLSDPRKSAPERMKTVIRQPFA